MFIFSRWNGCARESRASWATNGETMNAEMCHHEFHGFYSSAWKSFHDREVRSVLLQKPLLGAKDVLFSFDWTDNRDRFTWYITAGRFTQILHFRKHICFQQCLCLKIISCVLREIEILFQVKVPFCNFRRN